jgi:type 1 fimbriae regulatory protein FimB/type 1 fimbriae regulatory protein FimE
MARKRTPRAKTRRKPSDITQQLHLEEEEVKQLMTAARQLGRNGHRDATMILLAFHHGLRASEVCHLRWDHVYLDRQDVFITRCKGSKSGMHLLFPDDITALKKLGPERTGYVFRSEAKADPGPVSESGFHKIVNRAGKAAGLGSKVHPHMLRHACGFWLRRQRHDVLDIQQWLGHVNIQNTQRYTAAGPDHWREIGIGQKREPA